MPDASSTAELALHTLQSLSPDIRLAVLLDRAGHVEAQAGGEATANRVAPLLTALLAHADRAAPDPVAQVEVALAEGTVYAVRELGRTLAVLTGPLALSSLVFYDLRRVLGELGRHAA